VTGAAPIFHGVMLAAERRATGGPFSHVPVLAATDDAVEREICALSGHAANEWCPAKKHEWVASERPLPPCDWHAVSDDQVVTRWPAEYHAWGDSVVGRVFRPGNVGRVFRPGSDAIASPDRQIRPATAADRLRIVSPADGSTFLIDPTLRREFQALSLRAVAASSGAIEWSVNGQPAGRGHPESKVSWPLRPGRHHIVARDASGRTAEAHITVR
jgi:hypothetical protein